MYSNVMFKSSKRLTHIPGCEKAPAIWENHPVRQLIVQMLLSVKQHLLHLRKAGSVLQRLVHTHAKCTVTALVCSG